jgi:hypothetical protein
VLAEERRDFKGRTVTLVASFEAGGPYDFYTRLIARHIGPHLPGSPNVIVQNMPAPAGCAAPISSSTPRRATAPCWAWFRRPSRSGRRSAAPWHSIRCSQVQLDRSHQFARRDGAKLVSVRHQEHRRCRDAFNESMRDPALRKEVRKSAVDIDPLPGGEVLERSRFGER